MSDILGKLKSGAGKVAKEADKTAHIKRIEMQIGSIKKQVEDQYQTLGQKTYDSNINKSENPDAAGVIAKITELKQQIAAKEEEIKNIKEDKVVPPAAAPGKKFCPSCGKENDASTKFCSECGTKMS
jgi:hypothetical protein